MPVWFPLQELFSFMHYEWTPSCTPDATCITSGLRRVLLMRHALRVYSVVYSWRDMHYEWTPPCTPDATCITSGLRRVLLTRHALRVDFVVYSWCDMHYECTIYIHTYLVEVNCRNDVTHTQRQWTARCQWYLLYSCRFILCTTRYCATRDSNYVMCSNQCMFKNSLC